LDSAENGRFKLKLALVALTREGQGWTCCVPDVYRGAQVISHSSASLR
jgi:hypothetical protein